MAKKSESETVHSDIEKLAREFGRSKVANEKHREKLRSVGFSEENLTNNALVVASVFSNAVNGDMQAVCKWQELTGEFVLPEKEVDEIEELMNDRERNRKPGAVRQDRSAV